MRPKFISIETIYTVSEWRTGKELLVSSMRSRIGAAAEAQGLAVIGHEIIHKVPMRESKRDDGSIVYRGVGENHDKATHMRITYERQAVSRKVRL